MKIILTGKKMGSGGWEREEGVSGGEASLILSTTQIIKNK